MIFAMSFRLLGPKVGAYGSGYSYQISSLNRPDLLILKTVEKERFPTI